MPKPRKYSLYQRQLGHWVRVNTLEGYLPIVRRVFQDMLIGSCMSGWPEMRLRPVGANEHIGEIVKDTNGTLAF